MKQSTKSGQLHSVSMIDLISGPQLPQSMPAQQNPPTILTDLQPARMASLIRVSVTALQRHTYINLIPTMARIENGSHL